VVHVDEFFRTSTDRKDWDTETAIGDYFDLDRLNEQVLTPLRAGLTTKYRPYNWEDDRLDEPRAIESGGTVIVEGVCSLSSQFFEMYYCRIWIRCDNATRLARGMARDGAGARDQWVRNYMPAEELYWSIENPEHRADVILDSSGSTRNERRLIVVGRLE
jgi:uridine kinase